MALTHAEILKIRDELFCEDVPIPADSVGWTESAAREFFERGGTPVNPMRLYAVSDLHWDHAENKSWAEALHDCAHAGDAIIIAGDIGHRAADIESCLRLFKSKFGEVLYCSGNHELWVKRPDAHVPDRPPFADSLEKLEWLLQLCDTLGVRARLVAHERGAGCWVLSALITLLLVWQVRTTPTKLAGLVWVLPLLGWYESNLDGQADAASLCAAGGVMDAHLCQWRSDATSDEMAEQFARWNTSTLARAPFDAPVITFSHFLPRAELLPPRKPTHSLLGMGSRGFLVDVAGSHALERQLRALDSRLHVFGHTHISWDACIDGVHYVQNAVRTPRERAEWHSRVDAIFDRGIDVLMVWTAERPGIFCPQPARCECAAASASRNGASAVRRPLHAGWALGAA